MRHSSTSLALLALIVSITACGGGRLAQSSQSPPTPSTVSLGSLSFIATASMMVPRKGQTATLLQDGRVLIAGGSSDTRAELYDPATGSFSFTGAMPDNVGRTATLLQDGRVLFAGTVAGAALYDPTAGTFASTGSMHAIGPCAAATVLRSGKVLIVNGADWNQTLALSAEIYDPGSGTFATAGTPASTHPKFGSDTICPAATLLLDGRVLITWNSTLAELYSPDSGTFSPTGALTSTPYDGGYTQTLLADGKVLVAGGLSDIGMVTHMDRYDPSTGTFASIGAAGFADHTATLLRDGSVLVAGGQLLFTGFGGGTALSSAERIDPGTGAPSAPGNMTMPRYFHTATLLKNGKVLVTGGEIGGASSNFPTTASAELYSPAP